MGHNVAETLEVMETMEWMDICHFASISLIRHVVFVCFSSYCRAITGWIMRAGSQSHLLHNFLPEFEGGGGWGWLHHPSLVSIPSSPA